MQQSSEAILAYERQITTNNGGIAGSRIRSDRSRRNPDAKKRSASALRFLIFSDQLLASATVATTATVEATSATGAATVKSAAGATIMSAARCHCRAGVESAILCSGSRVDTMGISAAACVVLSRSPGMHIRGVERVIEVSAVERSPKYKSRRIESPPERAVENSTPGQEGEGREPWVPIPSAPAPSRTPEGRAPVSGCPTVGGDEARCVHIGFRDVVRSQTTPAIKIVAVGSLLVELLGFLQRTRRQSQFVSGLQFDLFVTFLNRGLAIEYAYLIVLQIEVVESWLQDLRTRAAFVNAELVLRVNLVHLDYDLALVEAQLRIRKTSCNHLDGSVVSGAKKHARDQENFRLTVLRVEGLSNFQSGFSYRVMVNGLIRQTDLSLDVV